MKILIFVMCCFGVLRGYSQPLAYTTSNAHSHNDYEQQQPFWQAYRAGFGSIEADIFLVGDELFVAHTNSELATKKRKLDTLYLAPLLANVRRNHGSIYPNKMQKLQLLVDIKTAAVPTLRKLVETIARYPELTKTETLQFTISGNRPHADSFSSYPTFIMFDGEMGVAYSKEALNRVALMSAPLKKYTSWKGYGPLPVEDSLAITTVIDQCHKLRKPVRFWDAPDHRDAWKGLMHFRVDYLNTDKIAELEDFLEQ
jgi:alkaline phosphatase